MLLLVGVPFLASEPPLGRAGHPVAVAVPFSLAADDLLRDVVLAAGNLAALTADVDAVGVLIIDREVVEDVAVVLARADLSAAEGDGADGVALQRPVHDVEVVDVLLADMITGEPGEIEPVAQLPLHVRPGRLARLHPQAALVPVAAGRADVADLAFVDSLHALDVARLMAALGAGDDGQALLFRFLGGGEDLADAGGVGGDGLLGEQVLASLNRRRDVRRAEPGRRREDDEVHALDHLFIGVEPGEAAVVADVDLVAELFEVVAGVLQVVGEHVAHCEERHVRAAADALLRRARASSAAADEAHLDRVTAGGMGVRQRRQHPGGRDDGGRRRQKFSSRGSRGSRFGHRRFSRLNSVRRRAAPRLQRFKRTRDRDQASRWLREQVNDCLSP